MPYIEHNGKRILFVHIPKTGGSSIEEWMSSIAPLRLHSAPTSAVFKTTPQHMRWIDIETLLGGDYFDYAFTIVRDPYARIESEFKMRVEKSVSEELPQRSKFSKWLDRTLTNFQNNSFILDGHIRPQWSYIGDDCDIYRFEDGIENIIRDVARKMSLPMPDTVPHRRSSKKVRIDIEWKLADIIAVNQMYDADFNNLGYEKRKTEVESKSETSFRTRVVRLLKS